MRLEPDTANVIREQVRLVDPAAEVWLFGSRTNDQARGGDIDLLIVSSRIAFAEELALRPAILDRIGRQRLDLIVRRRDQLDEPLAAIALETGIRL